MFQQRSRLSLESCFLLPMPAAFTCILGSDQHLYEWLCLDRIFWFLSLPLQYSRIAGQVSPCLRKITNYYVPQTLRGLHEVMTVTSLELCLCIVINVSCHLALTGQLLTRWSA